MRREFFRILTTFLKNCNINLNHLIKLNKCKKNILNNNVDQKIVLSRSRLLTPFSPV